MYNKHSYTHTHLFHILRTLDVYHQAYLLEYIVRTNVQ